MSDIKTVIKNAPDKWKPNRRIFFLRSIKKRSQMVAFAKNDG